MMIQGKSCGYTVPSAANMRGTTSGTLDINPSGYTEVSPNQPFLVMTAPAEGMYIRSFPKTGKETDTGARAEIGDVYKRIKRLIPSSFKDLSSFTEVKNHKEGDFQYVWSLIAWPDEPDKPLGWIVSFEVVRIGDKLLEVPNAYAAKTLQEAKGLSSNAIEENRKEGAATYAAVKEWKKKQDKPTDKPKDDKVTTPPSMGMSTGVKVGIALGAAALVYFAVAKGGSK